LFEQLSDKGEARKREKMPNPGKLKQTDERTRDAQIRMCGAEKKSPTHKSGLDIKPCKSPRKARGGGGGEQTFACSRKGRNPKPGSRHHGERNNFMEQKP